MAYVLKGRFRYDKVEQISPVLVGSKQAKPSDKKLIWGFPQQLCVIVAGDSREYGIVWRFRR